MMISYRQSDLLDRLKPKPIKVGDHVMLRMEDLRGSDAAFYRGGENAIGEVYGVQAEASTEPRAYGSGVICLVKWNHMFENRFSKTNIPTKYLRKVIV